MKTLTKCISSIVRLIFMETKQNKLSVKPLRREFSRPRKRVLLHTEMNETSKKMKLEELSNAPQLDEDTNEISDNKIFEHVTNKSVPIKSESDSRDYLTFTLKNGLRVLLISDVKNLIDTDELDSNDNKESSKSSSVGGSDLDENEIDDEFEEATASEDEKEDTNEKLAACALTVGVGSFSDPETIPGLAHFLEHMVFMGSKKYPKENDFDAYISTHGGSDNALTECENTTFYFETPEIYLEGGLDRFANFFISPLMNRDSINKEREAVESEFKMHLASDTYRLEQLFCGIATPENPAHKFMWGNLITLKKNVDDDTLYEELRNFWSRHYSAHRMTVAIQARLPLEILTEWSIKYFGEIPNNNLPPETFPKDSLFKMDLFHKMYTVKPVKDKNLVVLAWQMPPILDFYKSKPIAYLGSLIGHEGRGSLLTYLQEKLWAINVIAGTGEDGIDNNSVYSVFSINIIMTEEGVANIKDVLCLVFSYIKLVVSTGPVESIFREIQLIDDINFRYAEEATASDYVEELSQNMLLYPPENYINGDQVITEYDPEIIKDLFKFLAPEKANIILASTITATKVNLDKTEPWFGTMYRIDDIPQDWIDAWTNCEINPNFHLPEPNQYITTDFALRACDSPLEYPELITKDEYIEVWYKQDTEFKLPNGFIKIKLTSPIASITPHNRVMCDLFVAMFELHVTKDLYPAKVAGLNYKLTDSDNGLNISVDGYNEKLPVLLQFLLNELTTFTDKISDGLFNMAKEHTRKNYHNQILKIKNLATDLRLNVLMKPFWPATTKIHTLPFITLESLKAFNNSFFLHLYVKCLIQGNIDKTEAIAISRRITDTIKYQPLIEGTDPCIQVRQLPIGEHTLRVGTFNKNDPNCIVTNYYQYGRSDIERSCKIDLLMIIMEEPLFDQLRTQEQLGYDVSCVPRLTNGILGFTITVKSRVDKFKIEYVEERITKFLKKMKTKLCKMPLSEFNQVKESLKILKLQANNDLSSEVSKNWLEISSDEYMFDRNKKEAKYIDTLKRKDMAEFLNSLLIAPKGNPRINLPGSLRKLSVQVDGENTSENATKQDHEDKEQNTCDEGNIHVLTIKLPNEEQNSDILENIEMNSDSSDDNPTKQHFIDNIDAFNNCCYVFPITNLSSNICQKHPSKLNLGEF